MHMKAVRILPYRTRRLLADGTYETTGMLGPGDVFEVVKPRDRRFLLASRKAEDMREPANVPPPPPAVAAKIAEAVAPAPAPVTVGAMTTSQMPGAPDVRPALRAEYETVLGKAPFLGWSADVLREKIAAAKTAS